jgi:hypothetical protein
VPERVPKGRGVQRQQAVEQVEAGDLGEAQPIREAAGHRQELERAPQRDDQQQREPEGRHGHAAHGQRHQRLVDEAVGAGAGHQAEPERGGDDDDQGQAPQLQRGRDAGPDQPRHRLLEVQRLTEVPGDDVAEVRDVLQGQGAVEAPLPPRRLALGVAGVGRDELVRRVAGRQVQEQEDEQRDQDRGEDAGRRSGREELGHGPWPA